MDNQPKKLHRSRTERRIAGVCGGLADYFNVDPTVIRIVFIAGFFLTGSLTFWAYLAMWIVVPESATL